MNRSASSPGAADLNAGHAVNASLPAKRKWTAAKRLASEPLLHFVLLSALLWAFYVHVQPRSPLARITISKTLTSRLAKHYQQQYGAAPSPDQLAALVDTAITEEMSYREAIRLGLDQDDEIVRRRLIQKYEFLQQDLAAPRDPTPIEMNRFYAQHLERYMLPERLTFTHVYFSPDRRGDVGARDAAAALAATLNLKGLARAANEGDPYPGPADFAGVTPEEIARVFGREGLSEDISSAPVGHWSPPLRSGYGWHTVYVINRSPSRQAQFDEVRTQVKDDILEAERKRRNAEAIAAMRSQFEVIRE